MNKQQILEQISTFSEDQLNNILQQLNNEKKPQKHINDCSHLHEQYIIYELGKNRKQYIFTDQNDFIKKLTSILNKHSLGVCIEYDYHTRAKNPSNTQTIIPLLNTIDQKIELILNTINDYKSNAENADDGSDIQLFNKKDEIIYEIDYVNDIIKNRQDVENFFTGMKSNHSFIHNCFTLLSPTEELNVNTIINIICFYEVDEQRRKWAKLMIDECLLNKQNSSLKHLGEILLDLLNRRINYVFKKETIN